MKITDTLIGEGATVVKGALMTCHYKGTLDDGTKFDSSYDHGRPFQTVIGVHIKPHSNLIFEIELLECLPRD